MQTPKEMATQIINHLNYWLKNDEAQQVAFFCVNMIILSNPHSNPFNTDVKSTMEFWNDVQKEVMLYEFEN
jgi:hypothetical protein